MGERRLLLLRESTWLFVASAQNELVVDEDGLVWLFLGVSHRARVVMKESGTFNFVDARGIWNLSVVDLSGGQGVFKSQSVHSKVSGLWSLARKLACSHGTTSFVVDS